MEIMSISLCRVYSWSPAMLLGLMTGLHDKVSVKDFGLDNKTDADGLAQDAPSSLWEMMESFLMGIYSIDDSRLYAFLKSFMKEEGIFQNHQLSRFSEP